MGTARRLVSLALSVACCLALAWSVTSVAATCSSPYYSVGGVLPCQLCPPGYSCLVESASPVACVAPEYSLGGQLSCSDCPADHMCPVSTAAPIPCASGWTSAANSTVCRQCPAGNTCTANVAMACQNTSYAPAGSATCEYCPAGFACPTPDVSPVVCAPGTYSIGNQSTCTACAPGYRCPLINAAGTYQCMAGTYSLGSAASCTICMAGFACPDLNSTANIVACAPGTYSLAGQASCTVCPDGISCPSTDGTGMITCVAGQYSTGGSACKTCDAGYACPYTDSATINVCGSGNYSLAGATVCTVCPAGSSCASSSVIPVSCGAGTYAVAGQTACITCPAGQICPWNDLPPENTCPVGMTTQGPLGLVGASSCTICPAGWACANSSLAAVACDNGMYSQEGWGACKLCQAGYVCNGTLPASAAAPQLCPMGTYSLLGSSTCTTCAAGYYCPYAGMTTAPDTTLACPAGSYCLAGASTVTNCPEGTFNEFTGMSLLSDCLPCPASYFCGVGTSGSYLNNKCPPGYFCGNSTHSDGGTLPWTTAMCPAGTWNPRESQTGVGDCIACSAGNYCPIASAAMSVCPPGLYCTGSNMALCPTGTAAACDTSPPLPCPAGTYSPLPGLALASLCQICPSGAYCPAGSVYPTYCPPGTFNPAFNQTDSGACQLCTAGFACPLAGLVAPSFNCSAGHYCLAGTVFPSDAACAPGTYSDSLTAVSSSACLPCPPGFTCGYGAGGTQNPPVACLAGYYCPTGSSSPTLCPAGTYSNSTTATNYTDCLDCPAGYYCLTGATTPTSVCDQGAYCPGKSKTSTDVPCPLGTYSAATGLTRVDQCVACPLGEYCDVATGTIIPKLCAAGTYNPATSSKSSAACLACPAGSTCPLTGMSATVDCGIGMYSFSSSSATVCPTCNVGYFCPNATTSKTTMDSYPCPAGVTCPAGVSRVPDRETYQCPPGYYCPTTIAPPGTPCPAGTYQPNYGAMASGDCLDCPAGQYCVGGLSAPSGNCSAGYYCTGRASLPTQNSCPVRTYRSDTGGGSILACAGCPGGFYCNSTALVVPVPCPMGHYCLPNVTMGAACPVGTFGNTTGLQASALCSACSAGMYCETPGLITPTGLCSAGFYCLTGASNAVAAFQSSVGGVCPRGGYCPAGSSASTACPAGTFGNATGLKTSSECINCPAGSYCQGSNLNEATGLCAASYYCVAGTAEAKPVAGLCPAGNYCPTGSAVPTPCPLGSYMPNNGSATCDLCPAGYYCPYSNSTISVTSVPCTVGSYCPAGSVSPTACPAGSYGTALAYKTEDQCTSCEPSHYCTGGAASPVLCPGGVYCSGNNTNAEGKPCTAGSWCGVGSAAPTSCGIGYLNALTSQNSSASCIQCPASYYCAGQANAAVTGNCSAGFYCPLQSTGSTQVTCPAGSFCAARVGAPTPCPATTYTVAGSSSCSSCIAGNYCLAGVAMQVCPLGSYCPANAANYTQCPLGTYGATTGLKLVTDCTTCPAGKYCSTVGLPSTWSGDCLAGYQCVAGSTSSTQATCPVGKYCLVGTPSLSCPIGTLNSATGASALTDCKSCTPGYYCATVGLSTETNKCSAGYYCGGNATSATPVLDNFNGPCPVGYYCITGSANPVACAAGTYALSLRTSVCSACPAGQYCTLATSDPSSNICPAGYYCPASTTAAHQYPCSVGTYSNLTGATSSATCTKCDVGKYCETAAAVQPTGSCAAGFFCILGSTVSNPVDGTLGRSCSSGYYCPSGTPAELICPVNQYCSGGQGSPDGYCQAGYYCNAGSSIKNPTICPQGAYCPPGVGIVFCSVGTMSDTYGANSTATCVNCTPGKYCNATGMLSSQAATCPATYVCPSGTSSPGQSPSTLCPIGYRCPGGNAAGLPCGAGYYQNAEGQISCVTTLAGYYTNKSVNTEGVACPRGSYCLAGTNSPTQYLCPIGTWGASTGLALASQCTACEPGYYCDVAGATTGSDPTKLCGAGYYCVGNATSPMPTGGVTGDICPYGAYCVAGSYEPQSCAIGTLAARYGSSNSSDCQPCPAGEYCTGADLTGVIPLCDAGYWCTGGSAVPNPDTTATPAIPGGIPCPAGTFCVAGNSATPPTCAPGTYNTAKAQSYCPTCPPAYYCPLNGTASLMGLECTAGHYCSGGNIAPTPCLPGTYSTRPSLTNASECSQCIAGSYCDGPDTTAPSGLCDAGFICTGGASTSQPTGVYPASGKCPAGSYCPAGATTPLKCPQGTYSPTLGLSTVSQCSNCTAGKYCATVGLTAPSGNCTGGFYCPLNSIVPNAVVCPIGHKCPGGAAFPTLCPDASYNSATGQTSCSPCDAGWTCTNGSVLATQSPCPLGSYCLSGTLPQPCLAGTYGLITGLAAADECASCITGSYCSGSGFVTDSCSAGYLCYSGAGTPNPAGPLNPTTGSANAGPCPSGYYCPEGTLDAILCPSGTSRLLTGGTQISDCGPCPAGYECPTSIPVPCSTGFYCPVNNTGAIPCPPGTYNRDTGSVDMQSCLACPGGYTCPFFNTSAYLGRPCPVGHYCPSGSSWPTSCAAGSYRALTVADSADDCLDCPAGYYCPEATSSPNGCDPGQYCQAKSTVPNACPPSYYCSRVETDINSTAPIEPRGCIAGYYCPINSTTMLVCESPYYCPALSAVEYSCPIGSYNVTTSGLHTSIADSCGYCPAGTYSVDSSGSVCVTCTAGYICTGGTSSATPTSDADGGSECQPGTYCPAGSSVAVYCPVGTYNPKYGSTSIDACLPCSADSFAAVEGSTTCTPCGSSAYALAKASTCTCLGDYRSYQLTDGSCKCKPGYEYYDNSHTLATGDSPYACQPIVYDTCAGSNRDSLGNCVSDLTTACEVACYGSALRLANAMCDSSLLSMSDGTLDVSTQVCTCASVPLLTYCDSDCVANATTVTLTTAGAFGIVQPSTSTAATVTAASLLAATGFFAPQMGCTITAGCAVSSIVAGSAGHRALIDLAPAFADLTGLTTNTAQVCNYSSLVNSDGSVTQADMEAAKLMLQEKAAKARFSTMGMFTMDASSTKRAEGDLAQLRFRTLTVTNPYSVSPTLDYLQTLKGYYNPTLCLQAGETVFWQIDDSAHYPVYQKDNFLNSNSDFDYGTFEQLAAQLLVGATITSFAFSFNTIGVYVFADAANSAHLTIIAVLDSSHPCPSGNKILPTSAASLTPLGVGTIVNPMTAPDLTIIWALLGMFLGLVLVVALLAKLKQRKAVRQLLLDAEDDTQARNDFKQLYLEIRDQKTHQKGMFNKQRDHFRSECDRICAETEQVKALLATKMTDGRGFVDAAINLLLQELTARNSYGNRQNRREDDMFSLLMTLQRMLTDCSALEDPLSLPTDQVTEQVGVVSAKVAEVVREAEKERARKRHLQSNAGIIGDEIVKKLTEHAFNEEGRENAFLAKLKVFRQQCVEYDTQVREMQTELEEKVAILRERRNIPAAETAQLKFQRKVADLADGLNIDLDRLLGSIEGVHQDLKIARDETVEDENEALESLEQRKLDVEAKAQTGIFAGLDDELAEAIRFFLGQARRELLPTTGGLDQGSTMGGGMMLGRGFGQGEFGNGFGPGGAGGPGGKHEGQPGAAGSEELAPSDMVQATSAELAAANEEEAERVRRAALENVEAMSVDELRQLYADLRQREEMMAALQHAEEERQKRLAEELLKSSDIEPEDEMLLGRARELLDNMVEEHRREEEQLHTKLKNDEEVRIAAEIAALESVEKSIDRKKADLALEMARRNELAASESEKTEIAHEHQVQLKSLEESLRADKMNSQKALSRIHEDARAALRAAKKELRAKQRVVETDVRADFERVKDDVEHKREEKSVKIEGVDLRAIERALHDGPTAPSAKQQALANFHLQTQQEMAKKQQGDERRLQEEAEKERQKELDVLDRQFDERKARDIEELDHRLQQERASLGDEEQAKALMLQHQNQLAALGFEIDAERARQKAHLNAALARKRKAKETKLKAEHALEMEAEILEQKKEMDATEKMGMRKKETEALSLLLTRENHRKAKAIIEKIIKPRQHKEVSALIQTNFKEAALALSENLEKAMEGATNHREDVDRRLEANEITPEDAQRELKLIEEEVNPDTIKGTTLQYLEPQQNEKLTLQKRAHFQEVKDLMKRFYPNENFEGAEWTMEEATFNVAAMLKEAERRKKEQDEMFAEQVRELERREAEQLAALELLKAQKLAEMEEKMAEDNRRLQADFETQLVIKKKEFEEQARLETERAVAAEMAALEAREQQTRLLEEEARANALSVEETAALEAEKVAIEEAKVAVIAEAEAATRDQQKQYELEAERQRKKNATKQLLREQELKLDAMNKLETEHMKNIEQQKANLTAAGEKLKANTEEQEARKREVTNLAARAFVRFGRDYDEHRALGIAAAVRRIRKLYDRVRGGKGVPFGLVPGPVAGTMLQVPLQPGMPLIGGGGAVAGEGVTGGMGGVGGMMGMGMGGGFPGAGEAGQPFFNKLVGIEAQLGRMMKTANDGLFAADLLPHFAPGEEALVCEGRDPENVDLAKLTPKKFVLYRFGLFILDFLAEAHACPQVRLLFASKLPAKVDAQAYAENAFKNSFHFDPLRRTLHVRLERTEEVGEFTLLLVHTLSHVLAGTWSDAHPRFVEVFHRSLQFICSELFFARTKKGLGGFGSGGGNGATTTNHALKHAAALLQPQVGGVAADVCSATDVVLSGSEDALAYKEFRDLFGLVHKLEFREDLVGEFLDLHGLAQGGGTGATTSSEFSQERLVARMEQYRLYNYSAPLQAHLRELERGVASKQEAALLQTVQPAEQGMLMPKIGDKASSSSANSAGASKRTAAEKHQASVDRLLDESDALHTQLLGLISAMAPVSEALLAASAEVERLTASKSKDASQLAAAQARRKQVHAKLRRLNLQKTAVNTRIEDVEEKYKRSMQQGK